MHAVIEIDIGTARRVVVDERPCGWAAGGVACRVAVFGVGFGFDDDAAAFSPDQFAPDEAARAIDDALLEKLLFQPYGHDQARPSPLRTSGRISSIEFATEKSQSRHKELKCSMSGSQKRVPVISSSRL